MPQSKVCFFTVHTNLIRPWLCHWSNVYHTLLPVDTEMPNTRLVAPSLHFYQHMFPKGIMC